MKRFKKLVRRRNQEERDGGDGVPAVAERCGFRVCMEPASRTTRSSSLLKARVLDGFPFRFGRWSPHPPGEFEDHKGDAHELMIREREPYRLSRLQCTIVFEHDAFRVIDKGSRKGTIVNGTRIGRRGEETETVLSEGQNQLILGGGDSPYRFTIIVERLEASGAGAAV